MPKKQLPATTACREDLIMPSAHVQTNHNKVSTSCKESTDMGKPWIFLINSIKVRITAHILELQEIKIVDQ